MAGAALVAVIGLASSGARAFGTAGYFPLTDGATWTFNKNGSGSYTTKVLPGTVSVNGANTKVLQYAGGETEHFTNDANGIRSHRYVDPDYASPLGPREQTITFNPPTPWAAANATLNTAVTVSNGSVNIIVQGLANCNITYNSSATPVAFENVNVPAGSFSALKLELSISLFGLCGSTLINETNIATWYLVDEIGPVKFVDAEGDTYSLTDSTLLTATSPARKHDFNGDLKSDIVWRNMATGVNSIWFMNGTTRTSYATAPAVTPGADWEIVGVGDFDKDGKSDLMWRNTNTASPNFGRNTIWLMNGATRTSYGELQRIADANWKVAGVADFDGNGKADILWRNETTGQNSIWFMDGVTRTSYALAPSVAGSDWKIAGLGNFDMDARTDILWRNETTGQNSIWFMDGATRTSYGLAPSLVGSQWKIAGIGNFNMDAKADILWRNETTGQNSIWFMDGATRTGYALAPSVVGAEWKIVGLGDYNMDGKSDLMWRNTNPASPNFGRNTIWLMDGATRLSYGEIQKIADQNWKVIGP